MAHKIIHRVFLFIVILLNDLLCLYGKILSLYKEPMIMQCSNISDNYCCPFPNKNICPEYALFQGLCQVQNKNMSQLNMIVEIEDEDKRSASFLNMKYVQSFKIVPIRDPKKWNRKKSGKTTSKTGVSGIDDWYKYSKIDFVHSTREKNKVLEKFDSIVNILHGQMIIHC